MNDPNGTIRHGGWYHLFYQHNPFGDKWGSMHWGHARSRDLVDWEHQPIALAPAVERGEEHCFSGCIAADADGTPRLLYTSVAFPGGRPYEQWRASPLDPGLVAWERDRTPLPLGQHGQHARDPYVFAWQGRTFLIFGDEGAVALYEAEGGDLDQLRPRGALFSRPGQIVKFCECPTFFPVGDEWLLALSPYRAVEWWLGSFDGARFTPRLNGRLDLGDSFYATNTFAEGDGSTVVVGWIKGFKADRGWNGCLSYPRRVLPDPVHGVRQEPHACVESLRQGGPLRWDDVVQGRHELGTLGDALDCSTSLHGPAVLSLAGIEFAWDGRYLHLDGASYEMPAGVLALRVLVDRSVVEVFADGGRRVVTRVVYREDRGVPAALVADAVRCQVEVYRLRSCRFGLAVTEVRFPGHG